ncbi:MAG: hypothetical protein RIQ56_21 [Candidatus Parcubacteria bacterium]|jgi:glycine/D-amino acid oxidase-like deaminating enzyme
MKKNRSPWLHQLNPYRRSVRLRKDIRSDVAIIGAGIAGVATAYFTLKYTDKKVVILEKYKLAHGATGHNAGQVVSYFERGFASIADEFGAQLAANGQKAIDESWELLDEMYSDATLDIPFSRFMGHDGLTSTEQLLWHLKNGHAKRAAGLSVGKIKISERVRDQIEIPKEYAGLYTFAPESDVLEVLETQKKDFIAAVSSQKGCINSALFCQEVVRFLQKKYRGRFSLYEHAYVKKILLSEQGVSLDVDTQVVSASHVVLCTNGFEDMHILNGSLAIDSKYHQLLSGKVGYMSGYLEPLNKLPTAISYYNERGVGISSSYFYLTRRPYEYEKGVSHNLISVGGPDIDVPERAPYSFADDYPREMAERIDGFVRDVYRSNPVESIDFIFSWHGLMGYTKNGIRMIGPEPANPTLLYNLGCNGVGILPSIYGGKKISRHLSGDSVEKSIFDIPTRA